jgi:hypothetical protein
MTEEKRLARNSYMKEYQKIRYQERRANAISLLGGKCVDCGTIENLEFDHVNSAEKSFPISKKMNNGNWEVILEELKKCVLRCSTCHLQKSFEAGDIPPKATHGTYAMYSHHRCRCDDCKAAKRAMNKEYRELNRDEINARRREKRRIKKINN